MRSKREFHTAAAVGRGAIIVAGGYDGLSALSAVEKYDPASNCWTIMALMNYGRQSRTPVQSLVLGMC